MWKMKGTIDELNAEVFKAKEDPDRENWPDIEISDNWKAKKVREAVSARQT